MVEVCAVGFVIFWFGIGGGVSLEKKKKRGLIGPAKRCILEYTRANKTSGNLRGGGKANDAAHHSAITAFIRNGRQRVGPGKP